MSLGDQHETVLGQVIQLDRSFPLVAFEDGTQCRCKHSADMIKTADTRAVVGDYVQVVRPEGQDMPLIVSIEERRTCLQRKDPTERSQSQVLAANFDLVLVAHPIHELNVNRLQRELVLAFETGARVGVVLTKADLAADQQSIDEVCQTVENLTGDKSCIVVMARDDEVALDKLRALIPAGTTAVFIGRSGVGKSSMINMLVGHELQETQSVRDFDGKGRHTTVNRSICEIPDAGRIIDMPGVRGLGMWESDAGIETAFDDIEELAEGCKFGDCSHVSEPGCAVRAAVAEGELSQARLDAYVKLKDETRGVRRRREQAAWKHGKMDQVRTFKLKSNRS